MAIPLGTVNCPGCDSDDFEILAIGPDYDHHCCGDQQFRMVRCRKCTTCYLNPRPTVDTLGIIYAPETYYSYEFSKQGHPSVLRARRRRDISKIHYLLRFAPTPVGELKIL